MWLAESNMPAATEKDGRLDVFFNEAKRSERFNRWLSARMPPANSVTLDQRKIFILPTRQGMYFALLVCAMVIAGINYQNSLIFALAFLLVSLFMVAMLHTYRNLSGLTLVAGSTRPAFAGEEAEFTTVLKRLGDRTYESLQVGWNRELLSRAELVQDMEVRIRSFVYAEKRGRFNPGRIMVQTFYPLGLFRSWSWVDLDMSTIVYPRPIAGGEVASAVTTSDKEGELVFRDGAEDFYGLREYQPGDSTRHIAWKAYARSETLMTKQYAAYADRRVWLEWDYFAGMDKERRLSHLCYWVLALNSTNDEYGLRLPGVEIEPGRGEPHRDRVLRALALYEVD
jgi:uncharacterized protein (DUF58 family)